MKKYLLVFVYLFFSIGYTQSKFKPGVYVSQGEQKGVELKINQDDTYELIFLSGKIQNGKDTLLLKNKYFKESVFEVTEITNVVNSSILNLNFNLKSYNYFSSTIYIGLQKAENDIVEYKSIHYYIKNDSQFREEENTIKFSVDRPKYIYLAKKENSRIAVSKFLINENVSGLDIKTSFNSISNLELKAYFKDENSIIVTEGKQPLLFTMVNQDAVIPDTTLKPIEVNNDAKIVLPINEDSYGNEFDFEYSSSENEYVFKHKIDATLKEALETLKKSPTKLLVVAQNTTKEDFETFVKQDEQNLTSIMYYEYNSDYDLYNYYLATKKDEKFFKSASNEKQLFVLNAEGEILYFTNGSLKENKELFGSYSATNEELVKANAYTVLDRLFANKKSSVQEVKAVFSKIMEMQTHYDYGIVEEVARELPPPPPPTIEEFENATNVEYAVESVEAVAEAVAEDYYNIKDKQNLYQLKTTKEVVEAKWEQVLDFYLKQNEFDIDVVKILKKELTGEGFSMKLFNDNKETFSALDYKGLDYLLKFYSQIKIADSSEKEVDEDYYSYDENIDDVISRVLNKRASTYYDYSKEDKLKALAYYKKYVDITNNKIRALSSYLSLLKENLNILDSKNQYYNAFENYYNSIVQLNNKSLIEALDEAYEKSETTNWSDFKYTFSNLANDVSWSVVENEKMLN
ncbi:MAG: hypothetical protein HC854_07730 [Flavobacterium sp.]|nr:hypothetical protein [Flavobacterium sp.]